YSVVECPWCDMALLHETKLEVMFDFFVASIRPSLLRLVLLALMLWGQLVDFLAASSLSAYCVGGKCNVVRWESERIGCSTAVSGMDEFSTFCGKHFTWFGSGNRCNRLDRFLVSPLWMIFL
ncbi:hypothetical protein V6N12_033666, partial [Hibiscus sabdariffa]